MPSPISSMTLLVLRHLAVVLALAAIVGFGCAKQEESKESANTAAGLKDIDETRQLIQGMRARDQDRAGDPLALGELALAQKDQMHAETELNTALKLHQKSAAAYTALGNVHW